jgi:hypothetical protein
LRGIVQSDRGLKGNSEYFLTRHRCSNMLAQRRKGAGPYEASHTSLV